MSFALQLCGWRVHSALPLPELRPAPPAPAMPPDIAIERGVVPATLPDPVFSGALLQVGRDGACRIGIPGGPTFLVEGTGRRVTVGTELPEDSSRIRTFLLGSVFAIICQRRQAVPLHACCVRLPSAAGDIAVAFTASSGSGKSTLASAFLERGYQVLADDLTVLTKESNGRVMALPTFPRIRLWRDMMNSFQHPIETSERVREDMEKFAIPLGAGFAETAFPLAAVYHLSRVEDDRHAGLTRLHGLSGTIRFIQAVYQHRALARAAPDRPAYMSLITEVAGAIPEHWLLVQRSGLDQLGSLVERIAAAHAEPMPL